MHQAMPRERLLAILPFIDTGRRRLYFAPELAHLLLFCAPAIFVCFRETMSGIL